MTHETLDGYKRHREFCRICRTEMAELNAIAKRQTDVDIAAVDKRLEGDK